jgi:hypothetical protein
MDRHFIERQSIKTFGLSNKEFEHNYRVDDRSLELQAKLDEEYLSTTERFYESSSFPVFSPHSPIIFLSICTVSCKMPSILITASQVSLSQYT